MTVDGLLLLLDEPELELEPEPELLLDVLPEELEPSADDVV